jgi:hypothetical protein
MELAQAGSNIRGDVPVARVATECAAQLCAAPDANRAAAAPSAVLFRVRLAAVIADPLGSELCFSIPMLEGYRLTLIIGASLLAGGLYLILRRPRRA